MARIVTIETRRLTDKATLRVFLNRDRALMAYALGDLDDAFWPESAFYGARRANELVSLLLIYRGLDPPVFTAFGDVNGVRAILEALALPEEIYYLWPPEMESVLVARYDLSHQQREWRMVLDPAAFAAPSLNGLARLGPEHAETLAALYRHAAAPGEEIVAFSPWQIEHGIFYGVWGAEGLIAAAGTHVLSPAESVVAIGNVFTRLEHRGCGLATRCTAGVVAEARALGVETIILNVRHDNAPAIHVYEKLGFRCYATFLEGPGLLRE
jgi:ribosomal protein S18 acetylase RimI-like enzyme